MSFVIMTVGKTHAGKTTFGKKIANKINNFCLLDSDEIAEFLKDKYPLLYNQDHSLNSNELVPGYYLKRAILLEVYKQALKTNLTIISTSANSTKKIRTKIKGMLKKEGRKLIIIYFNVSEEVLMKRIGASNRSRKCLYYSKDFVDLLVNKQGHRFEAPDKREADYFFEIKDDVSSKKVFNEVLNLIKK